MVRSGQKTVAAAGTAVQVGTDTAKHHYLIRALPANTGNVYIGNDGDGDVTSANGYALDSTDQIEFHGRLSDLYLDVDTNDEGICWFLTML